MDPTYNFSQIFNNANYSPSTTTPIYTPPTTTEYTSCTTPNSPSCDLSTSIVSQEASYNTLIKAINNQNSQFSSKYLIKEYKDMYQRQYLTNVNIIIGSIIILFCLFYYFKLNNNTHI
jgi:hypothetical protein